MKLKYILWAQLLYLMPMQAYQLVRDCEHGLLGANVQEQVPADIFKNFSEFKLEKFLPFVAELGSKMKAMRLKPEDMGVEEKDDKTLVTKVDKMADQLIQAFLNRHFGEVNVISEESKIPSYAERSKWEELWMLDPLDGTASYVKGYDGYSINIAFLKNNRSYFSLVYFPESEIFYVALKDEGSFRIDKRGVWRLLGPEKSASPYLRIAVSQTTSRFAAIDIYLQALEKIYNPELIKVYKRAGALKICQMAEGLFDLTPMLGPTSEWDTAALDLIASEAGITIHQITTEGHISPQKLEYNKENLQNPFYVAVKQH